MRCVGMWGLSLAMIGMWGLSLAMIGMWGLSLAMIGMWGLSLAMIGMWGLSLAMVSSLYNSTHPPEWAATRRLLRIYLNFWRVDAVMQGAYRG